jgi:predicted transcriptional regulator
VVVAVDLDRELAQRLERFAARERLSTDEILSRAILESLGQWESGAKNAELIDLGRALLNSGERLFGKKRRARMKEIAERDGITMDELAERACNAYFGQDKFVTSREPRRALKP